MLKAAATLASVVRKSGVNNAFVAEFGSKTDGDSDSADLHNPSRGGIERWNEDEEDDEDNEDGADEDEVSTGFEVAEAAESGCSV